MDTRVFWIGVAERAGKTFAQAMLAALAVSSAPLDVLHTNWAGVLSIALGATLLSALTSLSSWSVGLAATPAAEALRAPAAHADVSPSMGPEPVAGA
jgi:hypothetical protein